MNWLMLRGFVPEDRDPKEIQHERLQDDDDVWTHLFSEVVGGKDFGMVLYLDRKGNRYRTQYRELLVVNHMPYVKSALPVFSAKVDVVFARGGFLEYDPFVAQLRRNGAKTIYYGAGRRWTPKGRDWDVVLVDDVRQQVALEQARFSKVLQFNKPAAPLFNGHRRKAFPRYDVCFVANGQQAAFKGVQWVYDTAPRDLRALHLGFPPAMRCPPNVTQKRVLRADMPRELVNCRVGIVPYWNQIDSGPRCLPEMLACGLPVVGADELNHGEYEGAVWVGQDRFWDVVREAVHKPWPVLYNNREGLQVAARTIREAVCEAQS